MVLTYKSYFSEKNEKRPDPNEQKSKRTTTINYTKANNQKQQKIRKKHNQNRQTDKQTKSTSNNTLFSVYTCLHFKKEEEKRRA